jgi:hypothetical protein
MSAGTSNATFHTLDDAGKLRDNYVNPYYLDGLKHRVSAASSSPSTTFTKATRCRRAYSRARR